jgi:hypothetical protein
LWVLAAFFLHWLLRTIADRLESDRATGKRNLVRVTAEITARSFSHAVAYVGFGVSLVGLAQAALWASSSVVEPSQVRRIEETLSWSYQALMHVVDFHIMAAVMGGVLVVSILLPSLRAMDKFLKLKDLATKATFVLLGATSFTFFGALDLDRLDPEWRAIERHKARATFAAVDEQTREMTAAAWIESEARRLDQTRKQEFARFFDAARATSFSNEIVKAAAAELGRKAPKVDANAVRASGSDHTGVPQHVRRYLQAEGDEIPLYSPEQPSLTEIRAANERLARHEVRVRSARLAAIELAADAIADFVPRGDKQLINAFVQELTSTLSKGALREIVPSKVADVASAKEWVKIHLIGMRDTGRAIAEAWAFHPSSLETKVGVSARAADAAVLALVARLSAQQQAVRDQINRMRMSTNFEYRHATTRPHVRFRR